MRADLGTAPSLNHGGFGVWSDHGQRAKARGFERQDLLVAQQHDRLAGRAPVQGPLLGRVDRALGRLFGILETSRAKRDPEQPPNRIVNRRLVDLAIPHGLQQLRSPLQRRARHLEIQPRGGCSYGALGAVPVGDDEAIEAPVLFEDLREQARIVARRRPVHGVVGGHHRPGTGLAHGGLEGRKVYLAQRTLTDLGADRHAFEFRVVTHEVLDRRANTAAPDPLDVGDRDPGAQEGILGEALEVSAGERTAMDVHGRGQQQLRALALDLVAEFGPDLEDEIRVPGRGECRAAREAGGGRSLEAGSARAIGAVRDLERRNAEPLDTGRVPHVGTCRHRDLFFARQLGEQLRDTVLESVAVRFHTLASVVWRRGARIEG